MILFKLLGRRDYQVYFNCETDNSGGSAANMDILFHLYFIIHHLNTGTIKGMSVFQIVV